MKKTSQEWSDELGVKILDPDGWDRTRFAESWSELIDINEFNERAAKSTVSLNLETHLRAVVVNG